MTEAAKTVVPYFDVLQDDFVKIPCDADLVFYKNWGRFMQKIFIDKKQLQKDIRSGNLIISNFANIGNAWVSKEAKLIIQIAFLLQ